MPKPLVWAYDRIPKTLCLFIIVFLVLWLLLQRRRVRHGNILLCGASVLHIMIVIDTMANTLIQMEISYERLLNSFESA